MEIGSTVWASILNISQEEETRREEAMFNKYLSINCSFRKYTNIGEKNTEREREK